MGNREIVLDTETTGFHAGQDRVTEVGAIEVIDFNPTGRYFHSYIYSGVKIPQKVIELTGITNEKLVNKPEFKDIAEDLMDFIGDSKIVAHNADFDKRFINMELKLSRMETTEDDVWIDTLAIAREKYPGKKASLDMLVKKFKIDGSLRETHGAVVDALLLSKVYKSMCMEELSLIDAMEPKKETAYFISKPAVQRSRKLKSLVTPVEKHNHREFIMSIKRDYGKRMLWEKYW